MAQLPIFSEFQDRIEYDKWMNERRNYGTHPKNWQVPWFFRLISRSSSVVIFIGYYYSCYGSLIPASTLSYLRDDIEGDAVG